MAETITQGHTIAPEVVGRKSAVLAEVEADAEYITKRRFREHYEEQERDAEKKAIAEAKTTK